MTTTTIYSGMEAGAKSSSRVLRPPGGASNISFGNDEEKPPNRKNKMASNIFAEPDDPHAHRRNNPPGGKPTGVLCGEPSAPLRRCAAQSSSNNHEDSNAGNGDNDMGNADNAVEVEAVPAPEQREEAPQPSAGASQPAAGMTSGRRNPPGVSCAPPGGASKTSFGNDEERPPNRENKLASNIFAEPDDPHAHRKNNPPGGNPTGVLCGEPLAPLRRCAAKSSSNNIEDSNAGNGDNDTGNGVDR